MTWYITDVKKRQHNDYMHVIKLPLLDCKVHLWEAALW